MKQRDSATCVIHTQVSGKNYPPDGVSEVSVTETASNKKCSYVFFEQDHHEFLKECAERICGDKRISHLDIAHLWREADVCVVVVSGRYPKNFDDLVKEKWKELGSEGWMKVMNANITYVWCSEDVQTKPVTIPTLGLLLDLIYEHQQEFNTSRNTSIQKRLEDAQKLKVLAIDEKAPFKVANQLILQDWTWAPGEDECFQTLHRIGDEFFEWTGCNYEPKTKSGMRAELYKRLSGAVRIGDGTSINPDKNLVTKIEDAICAAAHLDGDPERNFWIDDNGPTSLIALKNGLLDPSTRTLIPNTPRYFNRCSLPIWYEPDSPSEPTEWLRFLNSVWGDDDESVRLLQQWFGYLIAGGTEQQKILLLVGPPRSGKGVLAGILTQLIGATNVAGPSLDDFGSQFGCAQLLGKRIAIVGDARFAGRADQMAQVAAKLLSISSGDTLTVDRKYGRPWIGVIQARLVVCTNEVPRLPDQSGALASRFSVLRMQRSFVGKEDLTLADRMRREMPSILAWALDGWDALQARGRFIEPSSSVSTSADLAELGSPIKSFVDDQCAIDEAAKTTCESLYRAWCAWCAVQGRDHPGSLAMFGRDLRAAFPTVSTEQLRAGELRGKRAYAGIKLRSESAF